MNRFKIALIFAGVMSAVIGFTIAGNTPQAVRDIQTLSGDQANRLQDYINSRPSSGGGGGGGTGNALTNSVNQKFTGTNSFDRLSAHFASFGTNDYSPVDEPYYCIAIHPLRNQGGIIMGNQNAGLSSVGITIGQENETGPGVLFELASGNAQMRALDAANAVVSSDQHLVQLFGFTGVQIGSSGTSMINSPATAATFQPPSIPANTTFSTNIVFAAVAKGSPIIVGADTYILGLSYDAVCTNAGVATLNISNKNLITAIAPSNTTYQLRAFNP